ncbi:MAG: NAD+ synthase [Candidatus Omnitrophica bacterium]|nr:NAD+ synthase [Candidatus Omnitrophota bacterium]
MKIKIIKWIKKQVSLAKAGGLVLGLSGGLDSCVAAVLAIKALGKNRVLSLILPCHSHNNDLKHARMVSRKFGIKNKVIDLSGIYDSLLKALPAADRMTRVNLRPRLRMMVLYYFARKLKYLVCGTSNKSELMTGYFTKYGDGASDILPIGDLVKSRVKALARELGIPEAVIAKPPTAGLWDGQTDEADLGITYLELDDILLRLGKRRKQVIAGAKVNKVKRLIKNSEHKRHKPAVCRI